MNNRNLIHPLAAGDLVQSAQVLMQEFDPHPVDTKVEMHLCEVLKVERVLRGSGFPSHWLKITFVDLARPSESKPFTITMKETSPLLVTGISL